MAQSHHKLVAWQLSIELVRSVYTLTRSFPSDEKFGLVSQLRRAAVSVPSNIAEGAARGTPRDYTRFLYISRGSLSEMETQLILAEELGFAADTSAQRRMIGRLFRLLTGLINDLSTKSS